MDLGRAKQNLATEIALTLSGEDAKDAKDARASGGPGPAEPSAILLMKPRQLPRALITDSRGVTTPRILDYVDLLNSLDSSCVVTELEKDTVRILSLPELPGGALLVDLLERPSGNSYVVTGTVSPATHLFVLDEEGGTTTHEIKLPRICYRANWSEAERSVKTLALALCSPELSGEPTAATELYRWPFSNVYHDFGGILEGVCWPAKNQVDLTPAQIPQRMVAEFAGMPNNAERYTQDLSHNAPVAGYRPFLDLVEKAGGLEHDWLNPCAMNIRDLHQQRRRKS